MPGSRPCHSFPYLCCSDKDLKTILNIRCQEEDVDMTGEALDALARIAKETGSLRYAMHMIMAANLTARQRKAAEVDVEDIKRVYGLFSDLRRSTQYLIDHNKQFMFNEIGGGDDDAEDGGVEGGADVGAGAAAAGAGAGAARMDE